MKFVRAWNIRGDCENVWRLHRFRCPRNSPCFLAVVKLKTILFFLAKRKADSSTENSTPCLRLLRTGKDKLTSTTWASSIAAESTVLVTCTLCAPFSKTSGESSVVDSASDGDESWNTSLWKNRRNIVFWDSWVQQHWISDALRYFDETFRNSFTAHLMSDFRKLLTDF